MVVFDFRRVIPPSIVNEAWQLNRYNAIGFPVLATGLFSHGCFYPDGNSCRGRMFPRDIGAPELRNGFGDCQKPRLIFPATELRHGKRPGSSLRVSPPSGICYLFQATILSGTMPTGERLRNPSHQLFVAAVL
jgi:hypothetical protein